MRIIIISFFLILFVSSQNKAQDLLNELESIESNNMPLLPEKFLVTKKIFWGKKGLMRNFNRFKLTPENRQNELKLRKSMFKAHQILGFITLGEMLVQGIIGSQLYNGKDIKNAHKTMGRIVNITYFTNASIPLFSPPKMFNERKGFSNIKLHKILAIVHFSSMVVTNILSHHIHKNYDLRKYHKAAAYTAFGSYAASMIVIKF